MSLSRTYRWICKACPALRSFSYADTAAIAARTHAHEFGHDVRVEWWANYRPHSKTFLGRPLPVESQGRLVLP